MDLLTLMGIIIIVAAIFLAPSSLLTKIEQKMSNKIVEKTTSSTGVIDIEKIKEQLNR